MTLDAGRRNPSVAPTRPRRDHDESAVTGSASPAPATRVALSPAELDVLVGFAAGQPVKAIALRRGTTVPTVKHQACSAYRKLGASCAPHAVFLARREIEEFVA